MNIQWDGLVTSGTPQLDVDLRDLEIATVSGGTYLYASTGGTGGLTAFALAPGGGLLQVVDEGPYAGWTQSAAGGFIDVVDINGQAHAVFGGNAAGGLLSYDLTGDGGLGGLQQTVALSGQSGRLSAVAGLEVDGAQVLFVADGTQGRITAYRDAETGPHQVISEVTGFAGTTALDLAHVGEASFLISTDMGTNAVAAYRITGQGTLTETDRVGAPDGLGVSIPTGIEVIEAHGKTWVVLGAAGTSSLSVMQLTATGQLVPTDHALDTLATRFGGVTDIATATADGWAFVVAGGADDGLSLFTLLPNGRLLHLETLVHDVGRGLENVTALEAVVTGGDLQLFVTSGTAAGVTQFSVSLDLLGDVVVADPAGMATGTGGDDVMIGGAGGAVLTGGAGADVFVVHYDEGLTRITDFTAGEDRLDLSAFPMLYDPSQLTITTTATGAELTYRVASLRIDSADGQPLDPGDLFGSGFDWANHIPLLIDDTVDTIDGNVISGGDIDDLLIGGMENDSLSGGAGDDVLSGVSGDDLLDGGRGDDQIDGGDGSDTAQFFGQSADFSLLAYANIVVTHDRVGAAGVDTLFNVETLAFNDGAVEMADVAQIEVMRYIASHADLITALGADAPGGLSHYMLYGQAEGRGITFDSYGYLASYGDLRAIYGTDIEGAAAHYVAYGAAEGRGITFRSLEYIASYGDLMATLGADATAGAAHYVSTGAAQGRTVSFEGLTYIASHDDLRAVFGADADAGAAHFITYGAGEGRMATFNGLEYIASHGDLMAGLGADATAGAAHYITYGADEGRAVSFDGLEYIASHGDLIAALGVDATAGAMHYITYGADEGRAVTFSGLTYLASHTDLLAVFGGNTLGATLHYFDFGAGEGRDTDLRGGRDDLTQSLSGGSGNDALTGTGAAELLAGLGGADTLAGGAGDDVLTGGAGDDVLTGGTGDDILQGDAGSDVFVFADGFGADEIWDFDAGDAGEQIDLSGVSAITGFGDLVASHLSDGASGAVITAGSDTIVLDGVLSSALDASDFIFV